MEKFFYYNNLYLIYKDLLKENNSEIFDLYYGENMTMQEVADLKGVSKSRIGIIIKNVEQKLDNYENILKLNERNTKLKELLEVEDIKIIKKEIENILKGE